MRFIVPLAFTAALIGTAAALDVPQHAVRVAAPADPTDAYVIDGDAVEAEPFAEWDAVDQLGLRVRIAWGEEDVAKAPAEASRYTQKTYSFPTGVIRVLEFKKDRGGMIHAITVETELYMLQGSGTVEVRGESVAVNAGDVVSYPSGVLRGDGDATVILWTVNGEKVNGAARAMHVRAEDAPETYSAGWYENGEYKRGQFDEHFTGAPDGAVKLMVKRYDLDGNTFVTTKNYKGGPTGKTSGSTDALIYVTSGKMRFFQGDQEVVVEAGDAVREIAGLPHYWIRLEDSSFAAIGSQPVVPLSADTP